MTLLPSLNRREERIGRCGRMTTGEERGLHQEEQVWAKTVIRDEKDWVIWRMKPAQRKLGEDTNGNRTHQEATAFLEEFGTRLEGVQPRGSKDQRRSGNGSGGGFTRRKGFA